MDELAPLLDDTTRKRVRQRLLRWYRAHRRELPWRAARGEQPDPYAVLVSEAMLQQTQVATVIPYFERFLTAFPTVEHLAAADEQQVLSHWQGLGYYRRARHLHAAARRIMTEHGGHMPRAAVELRRLPGVGDYTAGAIASIAFGRAEPILDGNVARVLSRLMGVDAPIDQPATRRRLWAVAAELVRGRSPGQFNQGLMELGALVCTKKSPMCLLCPLKADCRAFADGRVEALPRVEAKRAPRAVTHRVVAIEKQGRYLFEQRGDQGLWAGLWQLPTLEAPDAPHCPEAAATWVRDRFGFEVAVCPTPATRFTHQTTHRTIDFILLAASVQAGRLKPRTGLWRTLGRHHDLPLANPQHRAINALHTAGENGTSHPT